MGDYVLITGATSGIGREFVKLFASDGYNIVLTSTSNELLDKEKVELSSYWKPSSGEKCMQLLFQVNIPFSKGTSIQIIE